MVGNFLKNTKQIFTTGEGRLSSKRVFGGFGWCVILWVLIYCTLKDKEAPAITEIICIVSASLMGIGVVEPYFKPKDKHTATPHEAQDSDGTT